MGSRDRHDGQIRTDSASEYIFPPDRYALLAIQQRPPLAIDRADLKRFTKAGEQVARRLLFNNGYARNRRGDISEAAAECISQLACNLRAAAGRAALACPTTHLTLPELLGLTRQLSVERVGANEVGSPHGQSSAPFLMVALEDMEGRVLYTTPANFNRLAGPWSSPQIMENLLAARGRIAGYTIKTLTNICIDAGAEPDHARTRLLESGADEVRIHDEQLHRDRRVLSPHVRAIVSKACKEKLHAIAAESNSDANATRDRIYLLALFEAILLLLDAPDENLYALARMRLEAMGEKPEDIKRGLAAGMRHPKFKQLCIQIDRGLAWH